MNYKKNLKLRCLVIMFLFLLSTPGFASSGLALPVEYDFQVMDNDEEELRYTIELLGYKFQGEGIRQVDDIIYMKKIWVNTPESFWYDQIGKLREENKQFVFYDVQLSLEQGIIGSYIDKKECGSYEDSWIITSKEITLNSQGLSLGGLIYLPMAFKGMPVWFTRKLNHNLEPGPAYML